MAETKRNVRKEVKTTVTFANFEILDMLAKAAGADDTTNVNMHDQYGDSFSSEISLEWTVIETSGDGE